MKIMWVNKDATLTTKIISLITDDVPSDLIYCNLLKFFSFHFKFSGEPCRNPVSPWVVIFKHARILIYLLPSYISTGKYEKK